MNVQQIEDYERCERLSAWSRQYLKLRISPTAALYSALDAGLTGDGEQSAFNALMALAANPGLDLEGPGIYSAAIHLAKLAGILTAYIRGDTAWKKAAPINGWEPSVYDCGDFIRRVVLIDNWVERRKIQEVRSWRTIAEISMLRKPMLINFLSIGHFTDKRRVSPWTKALLHPRNGKIRFRKRDGEDLGPGWHPVMREDWRGRTVTWLGVMQEDQIFDDLVHSVRVPVPDRAEEFRDQALEICAQSHALRTNPPMRRSGCYRFSPCQFLECCHGPSFKTPGECGWIELRSITK